MKPLKTVLLSALILLASHALGDQQAERPSIGLALGSGGAGGLAHIAMLEVFEELDIQPTMISGTSIGAIVGALYAAGMDSGEIRELFAEFSESALNPPDVYIKPELEGIRLLHFDRVDDVVDQARPAAEELREQLLEAQSARIDGQTQDASNSPNTREESTHE